MGYRIEKTDEFQAWFETQTQKIQAQIEKRLANIATHEHFGSRRILNKRMAELKFKSGLRIYFAIKQENGKTILLLLGGNKNGQSKDIKKAESLLD